MELRVLARERAPDDVRVPAQIFRRRVEHQVGAELGGLLQIRARERVVHHGERVRFVRDLGERGDIEHLEERIRRRLDPDQLGARTHRAADRVQFAHVHRRQVDASTVEHSREEAVRSAVDVVGHDHVIALRKEVRHRVGRRHSRGEREAPARAFERGEAGLERRARGVPGARVFVAFVLADRFLREGRGLKDRDNHRTGQPFGILPSMDRDGLEAVLVRCGLHVLAAQPLTNVFAGERRTREGPLW